jgi:hypothetical protein
LSGATNQRYGGSREEGVHHGPRPNAARGGGGCAGAVGCASDGGMPCARDVHLDSETLGASESPVVAAVWEQAGANCPAGGIKLNTSRASRASPPPPDPKSTTAQREKPRSSASCRRTVACTPAAGGPGRLRRSTASLVTRHVPRPRSCIRAETGCRGLGCRRFSAVVCSRQRWKWWRRSATRV